MRWINGIAALAALATGGAALADMLVVRAVGPSAARYRAGQKLPDSAKVTLAANDQLVLLDAKGTKTLRGPGTFAVSGPAAAAPARLAAIGGSDQRRARVGAVRGVGDAPRTRPDIWYIDGGAKGTTCLPAGAPATLWRSAASAPGTTTITASDGKSAQVIWVAGQSTQAWPAIMPVTDGARFKLSGSGTALGGTELETRLLAATPSALEAMATALIDAGCQAQLDLVIAAGGG